MLKAIKATQDQRKQAYRVICGEIRRLNRLTAKHPEWQITKIQAEKCSLWQQIFPDIYAKAERSIS